MANSNPASFSAHLMLPVRCPRLRGTVRDWKAVLYKALGTFNVILQKTVGPFSVRLKLGMIENLANQEQGELCSKDLKDNFKETLYIIYLCGSRVIWGRKKPPSWHICNISGSRLGYQWTLERLVKCSFSMFETPILGNIFFPFLHYQVMSVWWIYNLTEYEI